MSYLTVLQAKEAELNRKLEAVREEMKKQEELARIYRGDVYEVNGRQYIVAQFNANQVTLINTATGCRYSNTKSTLIDFEAYTLDQSLFGGDYQRVKMVRRSPERPVIKSGVYQLVNTKNGKVFLGTTKDLDAEEDLVFDLLARDNHANRHLQNSYNLYGDDKFEYMVLTRVPAGEMKAELEKQLDLLDWPKTKGSHVYNF